MIVDQEKFLELINTSNEKISNINVDSSISFSKEIISSSTNDEKIKISFLIEKLQEEFNSFTYDNILKSKGFFSRLFSKRISKNDISSYFTHKRNKLIGFKTDLFLNQKNIYKTILLLEEELKNNKKQLKDITVKKLLITREAEIVKNTVLDITNIDETIVLELNNKKLNILDSFEEKIHQFNLKITILNQNITSLLITNKNFKKIHESLETLIKVTLPEWDRSFVNHLTKLNEDIKAIEKINEETNIKYKIESIKELVKN